MKIVFLESERFSRIVMPFHKDHPPKHLSPSLSGKWMHGIAYDAQTSMEDLLTADAAHHGLDVNIRFIQEWQSSAYYHLRTADAIVSSLVFPTQNVPKQIRISQRQAASHLERMISFYETWGDVSNHYICKRIMEGVDTPGVNKYNGALETAFSQAGIHPNLKDLGGRNVYQWSLGENKPPVTWYIDSVRNERGALLLGLVEGMFTAETLVDGLRSHLRNGDNKNIASADNVIIGDKRRYRNWSDIVLKVANKYA